MEQHLDKQSLSQLAASIKPLSEEAMGQARQRQNILTKPAGSLGRLEALAIQLAGIQHQTIPSIQQKVVLIMAADHGVAADGVSAYPSAVTAQMVINFLRGGAAINALARQANARVVVTDVGVATAIEHPDLIVRKVAEGTASMASGPAMTEEQMLQAIQAGIEILNAQIEQGCDLVATGDMGIGNTTASSAITAALLQVPVAEVTGRGTGLNDEQLTNKIQVIQRALQLNQPDPNDPLDVLMKVGGLEIAALVGVLLGAAAHGLPIIVDGFISGAAALVASAIAPKLRPYLIGGHISVERGHRLILQKLDLAPLLNLDLRLGEGTGAVLAMHIIDAALRTHQEMLTFNEAGVSTREDL